MKNTEHYIKKTGLITGAASGLGLELAILLARDGYDLILVDVDDEKLETAKQKIIALYPTQIQLIYKDLSTCNV
ncbi:MAG TPA: SDR family NAD(P)-dependent oxidoreductase, partial [Aequorivita sp.]|nr:SDR family NAD(P)-dependent oxidoreductase [Aequorivita sp.]